jgi:hypothetical protein
MYKILTWKILIPGFMFVLLGCNSNQIDRKKLIGKWELIRVEGENQYQIEHEQNDRPQECQQYLVITKDSLTSLQQPCYFVDKGSYIIEKGNLEINFGSWYQTSLISLTNNELRLKRLENNSLNTYVYSKVESFRDVNHYREPYKAIWNNPSCFYGTKWEYTGKKIVVSNDLDQDSLFVPPTTFTIKNDSLTSWMKCILQTEMNNVEVNLYAYKYDGIEMSFVPCVGWGSYEWLSDTAYIYRRVRVENIVLHPS